MPTLPQDKKQRTLSFRVSPELWERLGIAIRRLDVTTQAFCTEAIEKDLERAERKLAQRDAANAA